MITAKRKLHDDPHPEAVDRFNRLLKAMAGEPKAVADDQSSSEEMAASDEASDKGCGDTQTPTNTSEDAS